MISNGWYKMEIGFSKVEDLQNIVNYIFGNNFIVERLPDYMGLISKFYVKKKATDKSFYESSTSFTRVLKELHGIFFGLKRVFI